MDKTELNKKIMEYFENNIVTTIREMAETLNISYYRTERLLNNLVIEGKLEKNHIKKSKIVIFIKKTNNKITDIKEVTNILEKEKEILEEKN